jgi:hypothetical protein
MEEHEFPDCKRSLNIYYSESKRSTSNHTISEIQFRSKRYILKTSRDENYHIQCIRGQNGIRFSIAIFEMGSSIELSSNSVEKIFQPKVLCLIVYQST